MSGAPARPGLVPATGLALSRAWRQVRDTGLFASASAFKRAAARAPYRVMVGGGPLGPRLVVARPWRVGRDVLAIQFLASVPADRSALAEAVAGVAHDAGFAWVMSPMVSEDDARPFVSSGFALAEKVHVYALGDLGRVTAGRPGAPAPAGVTIRPARPGDTEGVLAVDAECFDDFWGYGPGDIAELLTDHTLTVAVGEDGQVVGYTIGGSAGRQGNLIRLAVAGSARRQGVASALVADAARRMRRGGARTLRLCTQATNQASQGLYGALGFVKVGPALGLYRRIAQVDTEDHPRP